ncbi:hypothetical protein BAY59_38245 [Prauserella coralliicola]|nr:hypothetical protein BAY59_38245 [Prauserella coralliicola]TKG58267.1 STAS domain-containing protein [Prauserella endophytica]
MGVTMTGNQDRDPAARAAAALLSADVTRRDSCCVVPGAGEVDMVAVEEVRRVVGDEPAGRTQALIIDMRAVCFCGSAGVSYLAELAERAHARQAHLAVVPSPPLNRVLKIVGLDRALPTYATDAVAVADLGIPDQCR